MAFDRYQSTFVSNSLFPTYKHKTSENGDSGHSGDLTQPIIPVPTFTLPEQDITSYIPWSNNAHDDPFDLIQCAQNNIKSRNHTEGTEYEGETDLYGLVSNILDEADSLDSYYSEGNSSLLKSVWSPKTMPEDLLQYFQSESKGQPNPAFFPNHTYDEVFNKAQWKPMAKDLKGLYQQFSGFDTNEQCLFTSSNGDMDTYTPQSQKLPKPPGLPMPSMGNSYLSNIKQSQHDYISPEKDSGNSGSLNNFPDLNDSFAPQSKMSSQCFDPDYGDHFNQGSVNPISNKQYAPQEVNKLVSNLQALVTGEQVSLHGREPQNTNRQTMEMHYQDRMIDERKFISPAMSTHSTTMHSQSQLVGEFGAMQREGNGGIMKQTYKGGFRSPDLSEYFQQTKPLSASFNPSNTYPNKTITHRGNTSLPVNLHPNQYSQHHNQQIQLQNKLKPYRANCMPSNMLSQPVSEFVPQHSHQRGPLCTQDYSHGNRPTVHCGPGQGYVGMGPDSIRKGDGDSEMQLDKNRVHKAGFVAEAFSTHGLNGNARPQTSTHIREGDMRHGFPQNSYFDLPGVVYNSQRFGGGNGTVSVGKTPQFLPVMYPLRDPRQSSCQISFNSSKFSSRSAPPYGSGVPPMGDIMPDTEFTVFNPYVSDLMGCSSENIYPGMASILRSPRMVKNRGGSMSQFHFYLDQCYEQWRCLEKERKKMEGILTKTFPGKRISTVTSKSLPKMPPNPSRVDRLIIDQIKEQARVVSLLVKMERLSSIPLHANSTSALDQHYEAICVTQARRKEEFVNTSNYQRQGGAQFREDGDILLLVIALKELCAATRKSCTTLWCALQMTIPTSVWTLEDNVDSQAPCEQSSPEKRVLSF